MSYGFRSVAVDGAVQIDSQFRNYVLVQSGAAMTSEWVDFTFSRQSSGGGSVSIPIVMVRPPNQTWICGSVGADSFIAWPGVWVEGQSAGNRDDFAYDYRVFWPIEGSYGSGGYGLVVWDATGKIVYDSRMEYFDSIFGVPKASGTFVDYDPFTVPYSQPPVGDIYLSLGGLAPIDDSGALWESRLDSSNNRVDFQGGSPFHPYNFCSVNCLYLEKKMMLGFGACL